MSIAVIGLAPPSRHHLHAVGELDEWSWVEKERRAQHDTAETAGIRCRQLGNIARDLRRNMHSGKPEMVRAQR
jgi:hypothetical protein